MNKKAASLRNTCVSSYVINGKSLGAYPLRFERLTRYMAGNRKTKNNEKNTVPSAMTSNQFGNDATVFGLTEKELVFEWRPAHRQHKRTASQRAVIWIVCALVLVIVAYSFWQFWLIYSTTPELADKLKTLSWQSLNKPQNFQRTVELPFYILAAVAVLWVQRRLRGSRLYLSSSQLRHSSGLPLWLGNLLKQNWTLVLDEFRSGHALFKLAGTPRSNAPLAWFVLRWKAGDDKSHWLTAQLAGRKVAPASWFLIGQEPREAVHWPKGLFWRSLNPWTTPAGKAVLQKTFDELPLVEALRAKGVSLPAFSTARRHIAGDSIDLMGYPRMKAVVLSFFGLLIGAGLTYHFMRHQHYFEAPATWVWAAFGACCALASWFWLAEEHAPTGPSFKPTQGLIAALFGVSAALMAPSALLGLNLALGTRQWVSVTVSKTPLQLLPEDKNIPPFSPSQAREFWAELPAHPARQIAVRKGIFGTWQYDSEPLEDEVSAFYEKYNRSPRSPKTQ